MHYLPLLCNALQWIRIKKLVFILRFCRFLCWRHFLPSPFVTPGQCQEHISSPISSTLLRNFGLRRIWLSTFSFTFPFTFTFLLADGNIMNFLCTIPSWHSCDDKIFDSDNWFRSLESGGMLKTGLPHGGEFWVLNMKRLNPNEIALTLDFQICSCCLP